MTWIREGAPVKFFGDASKEVLVGRPWQATEYPVLARCADELVTSGPFLREDYIADAFVCYADKVGGHVCWIHHEERLFDENSFISDTGEPMTYIGQFTSSPDIEIGDFGLAYLLYSPRTGETIMYPQST